MGGGSLIQSFRSGISPLTRLSHLGDSARAEVHGSRTHPRPGSCPSNRFEDGPALGPPRARRPQSTPAEFKIGQIVRRVTHAAPGFSSVGLQIWLHAAVQRAPATADTPEGRT